MQQKTPSWIPDWMDESNYFPVFNGKTLKDLSSKELKNIAWQFLRRNPDFQQDYETYCLPREGEDEGQLLDILDKWESGLIPLFPYIICDPQAYPDETIIAYKKRVSKAVSKYVLKDGYSYVLQKYGLNSCSIEMPNPALDNPHITFKNGSHPQMQTTSLDTVDHLENWKLEKPSDIFVRFDLNLPINTQVKRIKKELERRQKFLKSKGLCNPFNSKVSVSLLPRYLRILDAELCGEKLSTIANKIFPGMSDYYPDYQATDLVKKSLETAVYMRDKGYKYFSLHKTL